MVAATMIAPPRINAAFTVSERQLANMAEARPLLDLVLADRIGFTPTAARSYELNVPIAFDRVLTAGGRPASHCKQLGSALGFAPAGTASLVSGEPRLSTALVVLLGWDAASEATGWILNISCAPRDPVNVRM